MPEVRVSFESQGSTVVGRLFPASGTGPFPTLLLLHGLPGVQKNYDLAAAAAAEGWNVLVFHYRGSWGSEGVFTIGHALEDVEAALVYLRGAAAVEQFAVDVHRIALAGVSTGGFAALVTAAAGADVLGAASIAGFNFGLAAQLVRALPGLRQGALAWLAAAETTIQLRSAGHLLDEVVARGEAWDLVRLAPALARLPVLLVAGARDRVAAPSLHHIPLVEALTSRPGARLTHHVLDADHFFGGHRTTLAMRLCDWLRSLRDASRR